MKNKELEDIKKAIAIMHYSKWTPESITSAQLRWLNEYLSKVDLTIHKQV